MAGAIVSVISGGLAWVMIRSRTAEQVVVMGFRRFGRWPVVRSVAAHTFSAFQARAARSGDSFRVIALRRGTQIKVQLQDFSGPLYFDPSGFEPQTTRFLMETLRAGDVFVDIGANIGYFTLMAASVLREKGGGRVIAFEPNPAVGRLLAESVRLSRLEGIVTMLPWAVSRTDGERARFYVASGANTGLSSLRPGEGHLRSGALSGDRTMEVECRSLDALLREGRIRRADVVKIDVESAELDVLAGGEQAFARLRPRHIICETSLNGEAARFLRDRGYGARLLERLSPDSPNWGNVLFTRSETAG